MRRFHSSFSAEHGIGPFNNAIYERYSAPSRLAIAGKLQAMFNPDGRLGAVQFDPIGAAP